MDAGTMFVGASVFEGADADGRMAALEVENAHLRTLLTRAARHRPDARDAAPPCRCDVQGAAAQVAGGADRDARLPIGEEFARGTLWSTTDCVTVLDRDGRVLTVSDNTAAIFGAAGRAGLIGCSWPNLWSDADGRARVLDALDQARAGRPCRIQAGLRADPAGTAAAGGEDGGTWWDLAVTPIASADGQPERILVVSRDITDLKRNEARQTLLMQELAHRVRNTLAMVQAVATQTLRNAESLEAANAALGARLLALAQAHDVLMQGSWANASLAALVADAVALHGDGVPGRFRVSGSDVTLGARPSLTLALMLHEIGTNAAKYGALSTPAGHVAITWSVTGAAEEARLRFRWEEVGGPPVAPPTRTGFGTRLIARSLRHSFGGTVDLDLPPTGAVLNLDTPLAALAA